MVLQCLGVGMVEDMTLPTRVRQKADSCKRQISIDLDTTMVKLEEVTIKCKKSISDSDNNGATSQTKSGDLNDKEKKPSKMLVSSFLGCLIGCNR